MKNNGTVSIGLMGFLFSGMLPLFAEVQPQATLSLVVYDASGKRLDYAAFAKKSQGNRKGAYETDVFLDVDTLAVTRWYPLSEKQSFTNIALPKGKHALAFNWPTARGYTFLVLDNGGKGLGDKSVVNMTWQAALDAKKRLDDALQERPDYRRSPAFTAAYGASLIHLAKGEAKDADERRRGIEGSLALDRLSIAYDLLFQEYGAFQASQRKRAERPFIGLTIERAGRNAKADLANVDRAASIAGRHGMVRFVFEPSKPHQAYQKVIRYAKSKGLKLLGEPVDSEDDKTLTTEQCVARFKAYIDGLPEVDVWEVGNEVNGGWTSADMAQRVHLAAAYAKSKGKETLLNFFWQIGTATAEPNSKDNTQDCSTDMFTWIKVKLPKSTRDLIDYATVSIYMEQAPLGLAFDRVMKRLGEEFPKAKIGIGELDYWCQEPAADNLWWYADPKDIRKARAEVCRQYYNAALAFPQSMGGGFWWYFASTSTQPNWTPALEKHLKTLRDTLNQAGW